MENKSKLISLNWYKINYKEFLWEIHTHTKKKENDLFLKHQLNTKRK